MAFTQSILYSRKLATQADQKLYFLRILVYAGIGVLLTHIMRTCILKLKLLSANIQRQILYFIFLTLLTALVCGYIELISMQFFNLSSPRELDLMKSKTHVAIVSVNALSWLIYILTWNSFYLIYHYITYNQQERIQTLQLKSLVKELELNTIKSHINPHFIFNAINSIRALVNENPDRARDAITELSHILRSSINMHKTETVPFNDELNIVKDYLALENMRLEDRLHMQYDIDENTLHLAIPPMMIQAIVENAIKHGISHEVNGGIINISSKIENGFWELAVSNTGRLNGNINNDGFGIKSTTERLNLIYGDKGSFTIIQLNPDTVLARVSLPLN